MANNNNNIDDKTAKILADFAKQYEHRGSKFTSDGKVRYSNNRAGTDLEELENQLPSFTKSIEEAKRKFNDVFGKGADGFKSAHDDYITVLNDTADKLKSAKKQQMHTLVKSYAAQMEANKENFKKQQQILNNLEGYNASIQALKKTAATESIQSAIVLSRKDKKNAELVKKAADDNKIITEKNKKLIDKLADQELAVKHFVDALNDDGITGVKEFSTSITKTTGQIKIVGKGFNKMSEELNETVGNLAHDSNAYASNLKKSMDDELSARKSFILATGKLIGDLSGRIVGVIDNRLQNLQETTEFSAAAWRGISPQEMNDWKNANRGAEILQNTKVSDTGDKTDSNASDTYTAQADMLQKFGFHGKAAAEQISTLNKTLMKTGSQANAANTKALQTSISQLQALEDISAAEATARAVAMVSSVEVMELSLGKSDAERNNIQQEQLTTLAKISRSVGFSADYAFEMLKSQRNARFKGVIDKITSHVFAKMSLNEYERLSGDKLTEQERTLSLQYEQGVMEQTPENIEVMAKLQKRRGLWENERVREGSKGIASDNNGIALKGVVYEAVTDRTSINRRSEADKAVEAKTADETTAYSASQKDLTKIVEASTKSLESFEELIKEVTTVLGGIASGPLGAFGSVISGIIDFGVQLLLLRSLGGLKWVAPAFAAIKTAAQTGGIRGVASLARTQAATATSAASQALGPSAMGGIAKVAKGLVKGVGFGMLSMGGDAIKENAIANGSRDNGTAMDMETVGAGVSVLGSALAGSAFGPVGMALGAAYGIYDNWDSISSAFTGPEKTATVSGETLDQYGKVITQIDQGAVLKEIAVNTQNTVGTIEEQTKRAEENNNITRVQSERAKKSKAVTDNLVNQYAHKVSSANNAYNNASGVA